MQKPARSAAWEQLIRPVVKPRDSARSDSESAHAPGAGQNSPVADRDGQGSPVISGHQLTLNHNKPMKHQHAKRGILLVNDDPSACEGLGEMLRAAGFNVLVAENGRHAVKTLVANPVSAVVLDLRTRFGEEKSASRRSKTLTALTDVDPFLPLILTCGADTKLDHDTALMADLVLKHPVQPSALLDGVDTLLGESLRERARRKSEYIATLR